MNLGALLDNIHRSFQVCPTWRGRMERMLWLYSNKSPIKISPANHRRIHFRYASPVNDIRVIVRDNRGSDAFIFSEVFDHRYYDFALPFSPKTFLDLGANTGFTTVFFARKYPLAEIACVEPMPNNIKILQRNLELNKVVADISPAAIAVEDGFIQMEVAELDYGHKVAGIDFGKAYKGDLITVQSISIKTLMKKLNWNRIGLLKIDIEGYEGILLKQNCDWLSRVDAMCIECHEGYGESDLRSLAKHYNFRPPQQLPGVWLLVRESFSVGRHQVEPSV